LVIGSTTDTNSILNLDNGVSAGVFNITNSSGLVYVYSDLTGNNGFTKTGAGTLAFRWNTRNLNYTGPINLNAGKIQIDRDGSLGNVNNDVNIGSGAVLVYNPGTANSSTTLGSGRTITFTSTGTHGLEVVGSGSMTIEGDIVTSTTASDLRKYGVGTLNLNGNVNYKGNTIISDGTLKIGSGTVLDGAKNVDFNSASAKFDLGGSTQSAGALAMTTLSNSVRVFTLTNGSFSTLANNNVTFAGTNGTTMDASGLTSFNLKFGDGKTLVIRPNSATNTAANTNTWILASQGVGSNNITAGSITVGAASDSWGGNHQAQLFLGKINVLNATNLNIGGFNGSGLIQKQSGLASSDLKIRGYDGTSAMTKLQIGETSSGNRSGAGVVDLNGGSLDAVVTELLVGRHIAGANNGSTSSLNMGGGSLLATTMVLGEKTSTGTPSLTSTMTQTGGEAKIGTLIFGKDAGAGATANFISTYNLSAVGASLAAQDINAGTGGYGSGSVRKINFGAGTIRNYDANTDLTISGRDTTASGRLEIAVASNANSRTFFADANRKITVQDTAVLTYQGSITKDGAGTLDLRGANSYQGGTLVTSGTLLANNLISGTNSATGSGAVTVASGGSLGGAGYIAGATTISGTLRPGNSPGVLTFGSDLTLNTGGNMIWELWANTEVNSPVTYDQTVVGGNLNVAGSFGITLDFGTLAGGSAVSWADTFWETQRSWILFDVTGTTSGSENLSLLNTVYNDANGASLAAARSGASFSIAQVGSDVVVNYIPEPSSSSLMLIGLGALAASRSYRRRS